LLKASVVRLAEPPVGVTGRHVRYVLAFGLAGSLIAFIAVVLYFGHGKLTETLAAIFAAPGALAEQILLYATPLALAAVAAVLLFGLWNVVWGRSESTSQNFMRWRVVLQFIAVCTVMAALYLSVR
jgi:hypothetical protein